MSDSNAGVPSVVTDAIPFMVDVLRTLAMYYHVTLEWGTNNLRISIIERSDPDDGETFEEFAARLREVIER
jgi:hypothetical protein